MGVKMDADQRQRSLRERAEALLNRSDQTSLDLPPTEVRRLVHDLSVYQIELELQNEDLRSAQHQLERIRDRYAKLYHHAPIGYLSLDVNGVICQVNQTLADQLGWEGPDLINQALADFMEGTERDIFLSRFRAFFNSPEGKSIDATLHGKKGRQFLARLTGRRESDAFFQEQSPSSLKLLMVVNDISAQKTMEDALRESEEQFRSYYELGLIGMAIIAPDKHWVQFNDRLCEILGYPRQELTTKTWDELTHPDDLEENTEKFERAASGEAEGYSMHKRYIRRDGGIVHALVSAKNVRHADGSVRYLMTMVQDITERQQAEEVLREREAILRSITDSAQDAIVMMDPEGRVSFWNPAAESIFGYRREEVLGQTLHQFLAPERYHGTYRKALPEFSRAGCGNAIGKTLDMHARRKDGTEIAVAISLSAVRIQNQWHAVGILRDETERQAREQELKRLATTDHLTGLANRRHFLGQMALELDRFKRYAKPTALLMLDLDHFKQVNDTYGHAAGDAVLQHFASITLKVLRRTDLVGRLGGEEFAALLPDTDLDGALHLAERLRWALANLPMPAEEGTKIALTVSIGVTLFLPADLDANVILIRADQALYRAKQTGRNRVEVETPA
ncbi:MAG: PAS domain S-box protein [Candidatus Competibacteraceae bacterium]|nr:PAS domain S-box protein [Candidatus Competibacteraceae bacterium]